MAPSKVLVVGGAGYIGKFIVGASAKLGHPTIALVRDTAPWTRPRPRVLEGFKNPGVTLLKLTELYVVVKTCSNFTVFL